MTDQFQPDDGDLEAIASVTFGERLELATAYAHALSTDALTRGLIGPREVPILWERHLLNCAPLADRLPIGARVVDVGSGAGLPGIVLAIRRPDLHLDLVEPLLRRVTFLEEVVDQLGLGEQVRVVRGRADDRSVVRTVGSVQWVTARAVAPLGRLVRWCVPLLVEGGTLLALKGAQAADEVARDLTEIRSAGVRVTSVTPLTGAQSTSQVVEIIREARVPRRPAGLR